MKKRIHRVLNFVAFNLLFFSLYLNFVHKDKNLTEIAAAPHKSNTPSVQGTVLVSNPEEYLNKINAKSLIVTPIQLQGNNDEKKISYN
ncbi:MAG: hypothetical protein NVS1B13_00610 [Flavisolibacter sp.]